MPNIIIVRNEYRSIGALNRVLEYVLRTNINGGYGVDPAYAFEQMKIVKQVFYQTDGVQLKHFVISFAGGELINVDIKDLLKLGFNIGLIFGEYQMVYGIHLDSRHTHLHFAMNTVSFLDGHKYSDGLTMFHKMYSYLKGVFPKTAVHLFYSSKYTVEAPYDPANLGELHRLY